MTWEEAVRWLCKDPSPANQQLARLCYYDGTATSAADRFWQSDEWSEVRNLLPRPPGNALELGAGRGIASYALARDGWKVTALEPNPSALVGRAAIGEIVNETRTDITIMDRTAEKLPFQDDTFDVVYCRGVLHHARNLNKVCAEAIRVLKDGGVFLATREHVLTRKSDLPHFLEGHPLHHFYGGENAFLLEEYMSAIQGAAPKALRLIWPSENAINLFPSSVPEELAKIGALLGLQAGNVPDYVLRLKDLYDTTPGRLFSFMAVK